MKEEEPKQEEKKEPVVLEDYIDDIHTPQGKFICTFIKRYFGEIYSVDTAVFLIDRAKSYYGEYELNSASDEFLVMTALTDELVIREITKKRVCYSAIDNKELETIRNGYMKSLDGLKALKKFDKGEKESDNKFTAWVDKLVKGKELDRHKVRIRKDTVDKLIDSQIRGIRNVFQ